MQKKIVIGIIVMMLFVGVLGTRFTRGETFEPMLPDNKTTPIAAINFVKPAVLSDADLELLEEKLSSTTPSTMLTTDSVVASLNTVEDPVKRSSWSVLLLASICTSILLFFKKKVL